MYIRWFVDLALITVGIIGTVAFGALVGYLVYGLR